MADSLKMATLLPDAAILVILPAPVFICDVMLENVSFWRLVRCASRWVRVPLLVGSVRQEPYCVVNDILGTCMIVDVDGDAAQGRYFGGKLV